MSSAYSYLKAAWHTDKIDEMRAGVQIVPAQVQLIISDLCNHDCHFCLTDNAFIDTLSGPKRISEIVTGDLVFGPDGDLHEVSQVSSRFVDETVRITIGERQIEASPEHPVLTEEGWKKAGDFRVGDTAVVRVRMRTRSSFPPWTVEYLHQHASAQTRGVKRTLRESLAENAERQPNETARDRSEGVCLNEGKAPAKVCGGSVSHSCGCTKENAVGVESHEEPGSSSRSYGENAVAANIQDRTTLPGMVTVSGDPNFPLWSGYALGGSKEPRLQNPRTEEVLGTDPEGMFRRIQEATGLDELRPSHNLTLPFEEVEVSCGVRQGPLLVSNPTGGRYSGIHAIELERGLELRPVDSVLRIHGRRKVYNFSCKPGEAYEANGIVVHNCAYRMSNGFSSEEFAENGNHNPNRKITTKKCLEIIEDCQSLGVKAIQFTGGGEPTVHPDHLAIFEYAQNLGIDTSLVTNGNILKDGWEQVLPKMKWVRVSVDASNAEEYASVRKVKPDFYYKAMSNIARLAGEIRKQGTDCVLGVGYVITRENWQHAYEGVEIIRQTGAHNVRLSAMFSTDGVDYYEGVLDDIRSVVKRIQGLQTQEFTVYSMFGDRIDDLVQHAPDYQFCGYQQFNMYIGGNLKVYRCCSTAYTKLGEVGDLSNQRLSSWFYSQQKKDTYANFNARRCKTCQFNNQNRTILYMIDESPTHINFV